jgi:stress response protein SCP2
MSSTLTKTVTVTQQADTPVLEVDKTAIDAAMSTANYSIGITSNATWTATVSSGATWCTLSNANATGNGTVTVNVAENPLATTRTATVTIMSGTLTREVAVSQAILNATLSVAPSGISAEYSAGSYYLTIYSNTAWEITVDAAATWCTVNLASATGNRTIVVNTEANTLASARVATLTISTGTLIQQITVTQAVMPILEVTRTVINLPDVTSATEVFVTSNGTWTATVSSGYTWCTLGIINATGKLTVNVARNTMQEPRSATVTVTSGSLSLLISVTQEGAAPTLSVSPFTLSAETNAASYTMFVYYNSTNSTWTAAVSSGATWCTLTDDNGTGTGNGTVTVNVAQNTMAATRAATVTVTSGTLTRAAVVTQAAAAPVLNVDKTTIAAGTDAAAYTIGVTSNATWTATVSSDATWCMVTPDNDTGNGAVRMDIAANPTVETRAATVTVTSGTLTRTVTVTQTAGAPVLEVDRTTIAAEANAANYSIGVTSNVTWTASVNSGATWCTLTNDNATGNGTVTVNVAENPATVTRAATIILTSGTQTKAVAVTQAAAAPSLNVDKTSISAYGFYSYHRIYVTCNSAWTATVSSGATWCTLTNANATGNGTVTVNVAENTLFATRTATVTVTSGTLSKTVTVTQAAAEQVVNVNKTTIQALAKAATYSIDVTSNITWTAWVESGATWCTVSPASATGNGTVTVNVDATTAIATTRIATIVVFGGNNSLVRAIVVTQLPNVPMYAASTLTWNSGSLTWSDVIQIPTCTNSSGTFSQSNPSCRRASSLGYTGYYYNHAYARLNSDQLCESPWRVPVKADVSYYRLVGPEMADTPAIISQYPDWNYNRLFWTAEKNGNEDGWAIAMSEPEYSGANKYEMKLTLESLPSVWGFPIRCVAEQQ